MKNFQLALFSVLALNLAACSGGGGGGTGGAVESTNHQSGACGSDVISDYNTIVLRCKNVNTNEKARSCKSTAQSFLSKYPGVNCQAKRNDPNSVDQAETTVTEANIKKIVDVLTAAGY